MKVYIPFRTDGAVWWANSLSTRFESVPNEPGAAVLSHFLAFARRKDAVAWMEARNEGAEYQQKYKIIAFESR